MTLLYNCESLDGGVSNKIRNFELRPLNRANDEARYAGSGGQGVEDLGIGTAGEAGDGDSFFRREGEAGDLEANNHNSITTPSATHSPMPTERTTAVPSLPQSHLLGTNDNHPSIPAGSTSFTSSTATLMDSRSVSASGLPPKRYDQIIRGTHWRILSVYRRLHLLVLIPNAIAMIVIAALNSPGLLKTPVTQLAAAATANILLSVLMRQELGK